VHRLASFDLTVRDAVSEQDWAHVRMLMREYAGWVNRSGQKEHICLQTYEEELASLPGDYQSPRGAFLLAVIEGEAAGCVALRPLASADSEGPDEYGEMKRLWVRPQFRGRELGRRLIEAILARAAACGYTALYLDTIPAQMQSAARLYRQLRFEPAENPHASAAETSRQAEDVIYMKRTIS
jgi:ribosomal protein S18 acetylase RimI-like enzyme